MSVAVVPNFVRARDADTAEAARLWAAIDQPRLRDLGWDHDRHVLIVARDHPLMGWKTCEVQGCDKKKGTAREPLCQGCRKRWHQSGRPPLDEFFHMPKPSWRSIGVKPCEVPGCERPWRTVRIRLCAAHWWQQRQSGQSLTAFLARTDLVALGALGPCLATACYRDRVGQMPYCNSHDQRLRVARRADPDLDVGMWRATVSEVVVRGEVSFRGLHPRVVGEVLFGIQDRLTRGMATREELLRQLCIQARASGAATLDIFCIGVCV
uniref:hypothetical protein n=1 Tax=Paractinoplanes polyasparticus TaxID=2856853 RepID=UPI001C849E6D|nr:hypothetical protein [Actinoplanes polyasparticus]